MKEKRKRRPQIPALKSQIDWTDATWNPVTGCDKVSPGCKHCYAERVAERLQAARNPRYRNGFRLTLHEDLVALPLRWKQPKMIFVNSMSDLFHEDIAEAFILRIFATMREAHWHTFQILTKRSRRLAKMSSRILWTPNIWQGVSIESEKYLSRIDDLRKTGALIKFLSLEPLLGPLTNLNLHGIHWVIVGGESGPHCRPMDLNWVREIRDRCAKVKVPFFLKQLGGFPDKRSHEKAVLDGRRHREYPRLPGFDPRAPADRILALF